MCGIAGIYIRQPFEDHEMLEKFVDVMFEKIEHRGRRATGIVAVSEGGHEVTLDKKAVEASSFIKTRKQLPENARIVLCHTRLDTQGSPQNNANNHPIVYRSTFMTHNGGIWNDDSLFEKHGFRRIAQVDSEIIAALLAEETLDNSKTALEELEGDFAIAAIDPINYPDKLLLAKGAWSPLYVWENDFFTAWGSTPETIKKAVESLGVKAPMTVDLCELASGEMWMIDKEGTEKSEFTLKVDDWESGTVKNARKAARARTSGSNQSVYQHGNGYWVQCDLCDEWVNYTYINRTENMGVICDSCDPLKPDTKTKDNADMLLITDDEKRVLEMWCATDKEIHKRVLRYVAEGVGFAEDTVDWLVFRAPASYLKNHPNIGELADFLDELYQEELAKEWDKFNAITTERAEAEVKALEAKTPTKGSEDEQLVEDGNGNWRELTPQEQKEIQDDLEAIEAGESCGVQVMELDEKEDTTKVIPFPIASLPGRSKDYSAFAAETYSDQCRVCAGRADARIGKFVWCNRHTDRCNAINCKMDRGNAVGTDLQGRRLCHGCSRGVKGFLADRLLDLRGFKLEPVRI